MLCDGNAAAENPISAGMVKSSYCPRGMHSTLVRGDSLLEHMLVHVVFPIESHWTLRKHHVLRGIVSDSRAAS